MPDTTSAALPPASIPRKTNPWLIIIVGCVVMCCLCVGAVGLLIAFSEPILNELGLFQTLVLIHF
jgi:hypothetical protein